MNIACISSLMVKSVLAFHDLEVKSGDILNAFVQLPVKEKVWTMLDPDFDHDSSKTAVISRASYCLKLGGVAFRSLLFSCMKSME